MLLTADIGNTNITLGVFDKEDLIASFRLSTDPKRQPDEYAALIHTLLSLKNISSSQDILNIFMCVCVCF